MGYGSPLDALAGFLLNRLWRPDCGKPLPSNRGKASMYGETGQSWMYPTRYVFVLTGRNQIEGND